MTQAMQTKMKLGRFTKSFIYASVALILGLGLGEAVIALEILGPRTEVDKTLLQHRIASAREINQALDTPPPPVEPLPPITARLANSQAVQVASRPSAKNPWSKTNSLPPEALDAMARSLNTFSAPESDHSSAYVADSGSSEAGDASRRTSSSARYSRKFDRAAGNSGF
jgi:hypothetical protein